ncbi:hypothetical protein HN014_13790 [Aquimarina sp. TRL1]|uniref:hypothetical protein n=1 Tax=Aquimarina sp. (strain TRL1) TaxID=2736252 RepID=UPI00158E21F8|nr:hypothetical protein [Aquimarina sp. TRL1]QKX05932.1 hypothetical protein HN014_13790 [Aquimarina sp. TRL1]
MEERYDEIEELIKKTGVDVPSVGFVDTVMKKIHAETVPCKEDYKMSPIVSKKAWGVIGILITMFLVGTYLFVDVSHFFSYKFKFSFFKFGFNFSGYTASKSVIYSVLLLMVLFVVQVVFLKKRIENKV